MKSISLALTVADSGLALLESRSLSALFLFAQVPEGFYGSGPYELELDPKDYNVAVWNLCS